MSTLVNPASLSIVSGCSSAGGLPPLQKGESIRILAALNRTAINALRFDGINWISVDMVVLNHSNIFVGCWNAICLQKGQNIEVTSNR